MAILILAGPAWRRMPSPSADEAAPLMVVVKVSPSMLTEDVQPSRLRELKEVTFPSRTLDVTAPPASPVSFTEGMRGWILSHWPAIAGLGAAVLLAMDSRPLCAKTHPGFSREAEAASSRAAESRELQQP